MRADASALIDVTVRRRRRRSGADMRMIANGLVRLGDIAVVAVSGLIASRLRFDGLDQPDVATVALLIALLLAGNIFALLRLYEFERLTELGHQLPRLLGGWAVTVALVLAVLYGMRSAAELSRLWVGYWFLAGSLGFLLWRGLVKQVLQDARTQSHLGRRVVLVGHSDLIADCLARLGPARDAPQIAGILLLEGERPVLPPGCARIGNLAVLEGALRDLDADQVILALPLGRPAEIQALLRRLKHLPLEISLYPEAVGAGLPLCGFARLGDAPLVQLMRPPLDGWRYLLKVAEDRLLAALLLILISPAFLAIATAIRLTSRGPILYRQLRQGFNREPVPVFKFRTMYADRCDPPDAVEVRQATRDDPRVTPLGRILRRTSLDELPQLLNVLRGEMSLVGPRPHALAHDDHYSRLIDDYLGRQRVKPGITGWAQVNGFRGETRTLEQMRRRIELDLEYIDSWSLWFDVRILVRTALLGFRDDAAY